MAFPERRGDLFWSRLEREGVGRGEGVGSYDGGRAFGAQSAPNHWAERGKGRVTGVQVFVQVLVCSPIWLRYGEKRAKHGTVVSALCL